MASSKEYLDFILEQLSQLEGVSARAMMKEYLIYVRGILVGGIYDDSFLVKPALAAIERMPSASLVEPYRGAKKMLLVDRLEDKLFLKELLEAVADELSADGDDKRK